MNKRQVLIREYRHEKNIDVMATRASNMGVYTVDSFIKTLHYFFEGEEVVLGTPFGYVRMSLDKAEQISKELVELIPMIRQDLRDGRKPMDARAIGKMLECDFNDSQNKVR